MRDDSSHPDPNEPVDPREGSTTDTSWLAPDPPPIPERIRKKVEPRRAALPTMPTVKIDHQWLKTVLCISAAFLLIVLVTLYFQRGRFDQEAEQRWAQLCEDYAKWFAPLKKSVDHQDRVVMEELGLGSVIDGLKNAERYDPRFIAERPDANLAALAQEPPKTARSAEAIEATRTASLGLARIESAFRDWPTTIALEDHHRMFTDHGWKHAAYLVQHTLEKAPPYGRAPVGETLYAMQRLEAQTAGIAAAVESLDAELEALRTLDDPVVHALIQAVKNLDHRTPDPDLPMEDAAGQLVALTEAIQPLDAFAKRFRAAVESDRWATIDHASFRQTGRAYAMLAEGGHRQQDIFRAWLDEAGGFQQVEEDWRPTWAQAQRDRLQPIAEHLQTLADSDHPSAKPVAKRLGQLHDRIDALLAEPFVASAAAGFDLQRHTLERETDELTVTAERLAHGVTAEQTAAALRDTDQPLTQARFGSAAVDRWWQEKRARLADRLEKDGNLDAAARDLSRTREQLLTLIDPDAETGLALPTRFRPTQDDAPTAALLQALNDATAGHREVTLERALANGLPISAEAWSGLRANYQRLLNQADALAGTARRAERIISEALPLDDPKIVVDGRDMAAQLRGVTGSELWDEPAVAAAGQPLFHQIEALAALGRLTRWEVLSQMAVEAPDAATAFAAWRRMGPAGEDPQGDAGDDVEWPGDVRTLEVELALQARLSRLAQMIDRRHPGRGEELATALAEARPRRWRLAIDAAQSDAQMRAILRQAEAMNVQADTLPTALRFNLLLDRVQHAVATLPTPPSPRRDAELLALTQAFTAQARPMADDPRIGKLLPPLDRLTAQGANDREMLADAGPARRGWTVTPHEGGQAVTFTRGDWSLTFVRIDPPAPAPGNAPGKSGGNSGDGGDARPFYLCTAELPVGLALDAVDGADTQADLIAVMPPLRERDTRKGPRVWAYGDNKNAPLVLNPTDWLGASPMYPQGLTPTPPTARHPINYVSAEGAAYLAATLGCRLPTIDQWQAAMRRYPVPAGTLPNLRDTTWARHANHAAQLIAAGVPGVDWANSDVFRAPAPGNAPGTAPNDRAAERDTTGNYHPINDATLWFNPTPAPERAPGNTPASEDEINVVDLVGNIAELVTTRPVDPDVLLEKDRPITARRDAFRRAHKSHFAVLGGSALSPATFAPDTPQPFNVFSGARGYADVGLRLAFTAPTVSPARQAELALLQQPLLGLR